jgi:hypothetical protein
MTHLCQVLIRDLVASISHVQQLADRAHIRGEGIELVDSMDGRSGDLMEIIKNKKMSNSR